MAELRMPEPPDDGLVVPDVGSWSKNKHHFLRRYIYAFTTAMRDKWGELHYVDLFSSAGIEKVRGGGLEWGSPMLAAMTEHPFTRLHLCELDAEKVEALRQRLKLFPQPSEPQVLCGDANERVREIVREIPRGALNLAFVDPAKLAHLSFETLRALSGLKTDLIVFFPDYLDALRNLKVYSGNPESALSRFLGTTSWERALENTPSSSRPAKLVEVFKDQMRNLGYRHFEEERIARPDSVRLYKLVFCSRHRAGAKIWRAVSRKHQDGQRELFD